METKRLKTSLETLTVSSRRDNLRDSSTFRNKLRWDKRQQIKSKLRTCQKLRQLRVNAKVPPKTQKRLEKTWLKRR